jgi:hypothetical protein
MGKPAPLLRGKRSLVEIHQFGQTIDVNEDVRRADIQMQYSAAVDLGQDAGDPRRLRHQCDGGKRTGAGQKCAAVVAQHQHSARHG